MAWVYLDDQTGRKRKAQISGSVRAAVARRYGCEPGGTYEIECAYCPAAGRLKWFFRDGQRVGWPAVSGLEWDHIIPEATGGPTTPDNIQLTCRRCNRSKGSRPCPG